MMRRGEQFGRGARMAAAGMALAALAACGVDTKEDLGRNGGSGTKGTVGAVTPPARPLVPVTPPAPLVAEPVIPVTVSYEDGERAFRGGRFGEAADLFEAYALRRPENPWGHYMHGISAWRDGDHGRAESALRRTIEVSPNHGKGLVNLGRVLLEQRKASDALDPVERAVDLRPESGEAWRVLGNVRADLGLVESAAAAYRKALELNGEDAWTMNNLGLVMIRAGRMEDALPPLARATELRPDVATFQNNLGNALERGGHLVEAAEAFRAVLAVTGDHDKARVSLERIEGRLQRAVSVPVDLRALASRFADEVGQLGRGGVTASAPLTLEEL